MLEPEHIEADTSFKLWWKSAVAIHSFPLGGGAGRHMVIGQARGSGWLYHIYTRRLIQLDKYYLAQIFSGNGGWALTEAKSIARFPFDGQEHKNHKQAEK